MFGTGANDPPGCTLFSGATLLEYRTIRIIKSFITPTEDSVVICLYSQPKCFLAPMQPQQLTARCAPIVANMCMPISLSIRAPLYNFIFCREVTPRWSKLRSSMACMICYTRWTSLASREDDSGEREKNRLVLTCDSKAAREVGVVAGKIWYKLVHTSTGMVWF